jgi:hypothetical protein
MEPLTGSRLPLLMRSVAIAPGIQYTASAVGQVLEENRLLEREVLKLRNENKLLEEPAQGDAGALQTEVTRLRAENNELRRVLMLAAWCLSEKYSPTDDWAPDFYPDTRFQT